MVMFCVGLLVGAPFGALVGWLFGLGRTAKPRIVVDKDIYDSEWGPN